jgi:hypothetical protein
METWILLLLAININNSKDIPGRISIEFSSQESCISASHTLQYELKFKNFKIEAQCVKKF